ncbi:hypothetical protein [Streptomyces sp. CBMA29]|uniref:phage terminase small subunit n=1 Tax=Streptomyces sp. CBMA29 TaxID=1896314 RepID=UPI001CB6D031|nr:hypothetical protein [Streptomyces sp. CBMA29]
MTTKLVDALYLGDLKLASEIRMRVAKWGATTEDRARLRMKFEDQPEDSEGQAPGDSDEPNLDEELYKLLSE